MLFFGHIGITVGIVFLICLFYRGKVDYRIVMVGSLLPDIIDKPLSLSTFGGLIGSGRYLGHTLFFVLLLIGVSILVYKNPKLYGLVSLPFAVLLHDLQDTMWTNPGIFYWPLLSFNPNFKINATLVNDSITERTIEYSSTIIQYNSHNLYTYETEFIGLVIPGLFAWYYRLYRVERLSAFIFHGKLYSHNG